jgi:sulfide:quinone oxidoreductase
VATAVGQKPNSLLLSRPVFRGLRNNALVKQRISGAPGIHAGAGSCYIEFGAGLIGRVDVDFFSGPQPTGTYFAPSAALRAEKEKFGSSRRARWFGR